MRLATWAGYLPHGFPEHIIRPEHPTKSSMFAACRALLQGAYFDVYLVSYVSLNGSRLRSFQATEHSRANPSTRRAYRFIKIHVRPNTPAKTTALFGLTTLCATKASEISRGTPIA